MPAMLHLPTQEPWRLEASSRDDIRGRLNPGGHGSFTPPSIGDGCGRTDWGYSIVYTALCARVVCVFVRWWLLVLSSLRCQSLRFFLKKKLNHYYRLRRRMSTPSCCPPTITVAVVIISNKGQDPKPMTRR